MTYKIMICVPSGGTVLEQSGPVSWLASKRHQTVRFPSAVPGLNFNTLWLEALNRGLHGEFTHAAICHSDIQVKEDDDELRWGDRLIEEMEKFDADFLSTASPIKDQRAVTSCGIGDPNDPWVPFRRFTVKELAKMPTTFDITMTEYPDKYLIHNEALCMIDLRKRLWYMPNPDGTVRCDFNVIERIRLHDGRFVKDQLTEDWKFSRDLWQMRAKTVISTRVTILHYGLMPFPNKGDWGDECDQATAYKWRPTAVA